MPYDKSGETLLAEVVDIPMGGGVDQKSNKQLFQPPFLAEGKNIEVDKTGSVQKRDGVQAVIPPSSSQPYVGTGTLFEHPSRQLGVVGQPDFSVVPPTTTSLSLVADSGSFATSNFVTSNTTGIYACGIEEDPVVRTDEAVLHVQSCVSGNKVLTVWCAQVKPVTEEECYDVYKITDNRCYYMVRERDTGTVVIPPTRLYDIATTAFANQPRYTHIALVDSVDPHWVIVAAPEVYPEASWEYLSAASISVSTNVTTYAKLSFVVGQSPIERFTAFDMHAGADSDYAHIIAQASTCSGHNSYVFRIDKTLVVSLNRALLNAEVPLHSGAIYHDIATNTVFTATSNQHGIAGALPGDGETWLHRYSDSTYAISAGYPVKMFAQTIPAAWPDVEIGVTGACTRLTIAPGNATSLYVFGSQFWNPAGYAQVPAAVASSAAMDSLEKSVWMSTVAGSKSFLNTKWVEVQNAYTGAPSTTTVKNQPSCYLSTKAFKGLANSFPMVGLGATNGAPIAANTLSELASKEEARFDYKQTQVGFPGPDPVAGNSTENQPSKHPMGLIVAPQHAEEILRPVARFGVDTMVEAEDVFPYECGIITEQDGSNNAAARWLAPGLSEVRTTEVSGEHLFSYKSRLEPGVSRLVEYNRFAITTEAVAQYGVVVGGTFFSGNAAGAFGGEEVRLNLADTSLTVEKDGPQSYFSGGYFGFFDGVDNGESDVHSSPGRPYVQLYYLLDGHAPRQTDFGRFFADHNKAKYTFTLVYVIQDEDGRIHRSAPSPERTVYGTGTNANANLGAVAIRYLMPPPSAFYMNNESARARKLFIEVYAKIDNQIPNTDFSPNDGRNGIDLSISNFTLIDRFEPSVVDKLQQTVKVAWPLPASPEGTSTTPWTVEEKFIGKVRSGFRFFGERVIVKPKYYPDGVQLKSPPIPLDGQVLDTLLYTTGGVLENDPPPAFKDIETANGRMWGIPSNNRSSVWYSKKLTEGKPPEWSAAFVVNMPRSEDELVAISQMDEKVVVFSKNDVFVIIGDGPNNLGRGAGFTGPTKVASDVGCVNKSSVVTGPFGVMFQSEKGIYALGRNLQVQYIGSRVEDEVTSPTDITSAVLVENKNQVRFTLNRLGQTNFRTLCYDYFNEVWTVAESTSSIVRNTISSTIFNSEHTVLGLDNYISKDSPGGTFDGAAGAQTPIVSEFKTAWIKMAGVQGFKRVKRASFLGQHLGGKVSLSAQYNYVEGVSTTKSWTDAEITALSTDPMQLALHIPRQKCQSIRFVYSDLDAGQPATAGDIISSISILFGVKNGLFKLPEGGKK